MSGERTPQPDLNVRAPEMLLRTLSDAIPHFHRDLAVGALVALLSEHLRRVCVRSTEDAVLACLLKVFSLSRESNAKQQERGIFSSPQVNEHTNRLAR
jgi:VanZ family protein